MINFMGMGRGNVPNVRQKSIVWGYVDYSFIIILRYECAFSKQFIVTISPCSNMRSKTKYNEENDHINEKHEGLIS